MPQIARRPRGFVLGDDRAAVVVMKAIDQYAVEAGNGANLLGRDDAGITQALAGVDPGENGTRHIQRRSNAALELGLEQLDRDKAPGAMRHHRQGMAVARPHQADIDRFVVQIEQA